MGGGLEEAGQAHPNAALPGRTIPEDITNTLNVIMGKLVSGQTQLNGFFLSFLHCNSQLVLLIMLKHLAKMTRID